MTRTPFSSGSLSGIPAVIAAFALVSHSAWAQQPPEPMDVSPNDGEVYYLINQHSGLQVASLLPATGRASQQMRSFTDLAQRWAFARSDANRWEIKRVPSGLCLTWRPPGDVVLDSCWAGLANQWELVPSGNGYYAIQNSATNRLLDVSGGTTAAGAMLIASAPNGPPIQSELWLLRPAYLRGVDNALLEKQEALRVSQNTPWWKDAGQYEDVLSIFKHHGINTIRLRPTSAPPYIDPSAEGCQGNACYAETEAQDLDLAKRAKNLGMSIELSLLFDGGNSQSIPAAWAFDTLPQLENDLYAYVKSEIERYRNAGVMPDLVAIGNEVDTGFLGALGSPTGAQFGNFAALQKMGMQAVQDAASDPTLGAPIPAPLTCIHITPAWDLTSFFTLVNQNEIPYDAICQSYYPIYHGPLTDAQAATANPYNQPVEQDVLVKAANELGKPIFIIETGEHYENGFDANDPWYTPTAAGQRQFLLDLQSVAKGLPNQLAMGVEYWDAAGVNILAYGGPYYFNGGYPPNSIYIWNGLTLFDNADNGGSSNQADPRYSELLTGLDAVGYKLDSTLKYKFVVSPATVLRFCLGLGGSAHELRFDLDSPTTIASEQWTIRSNGDGFFQISSAAASEPALVLDGGNSSNTIAAAPNGSPAEEWDVVSLGNGSFQIVNRASGLPVSIGGFQLKVQITPTL